MQTKKTLIIVHIELITIITLTNVIPTTKNILTAATINKVVKHRNAKQNQAIS